MTSSIQASFSAWQSIANGTKTQVTVQNPDNVRIAYIYIGSAAPAVTATPVDTDGVLELNANDVETFILGTGETLFIRSANQMGANKVHRIAYGLG